jgi:hypothetical protein
VASGSARRVAGLRPTPAASAGLRPLARLAAAFAADAFLAPFFADLLAELLRDAAMARLSYPSRRPHAHQR